MLDIELVMEGNFRVFGLWCQGVAKRPVHPSPLFPRCLLPFTLMRYVYETFSVRLSIVRVSFPFLLLSRMLGRGQLLSGSLALLY